VNLSKQVGSAIAAYKVSGVKKFRGHEGEPLMQGNLCHGKTKVAWWSEDAHGGCMNIIVHDRALFAEFKAACEAADLTHAPSPSFPDGLKAC